jgi:hypothetical protein
MSADFQLERPAKERSDQDNGGKDADAGKTGRYRNCPHDIRRDQEFETEEDRAPDPLSVELIGVWNVRGWPEMPLKEDSCNRGTQDDHGNAGQF